MFSENAEVEELEYSLIPRDDVLNYRSEYISAVLCKKELLRAMPYGQDRTVLHCISSNARHKSHQAKDDGRKTNKPSDKRNVAHVEPEQQVNGNMVVEFDSVCSLLSRRRGNRAKYSEIWSSSTTEESRQRCQVKSVEMA